MRPTDAASEGAAPPTSSPLVLLISADEALGAEIERAVAPRWAFLWHVPEEDGLPPLHTTPPDIILLDGRALTAGIRAALHQRPADAAAGQAPLLLLGAEDEEASLGAADTLPLPCPPRALVARLAPHLDGRLLRREMAAREEALQAELQATRDSLERILESLDDHFVMFDREWRYTYVNNKATEVLGLPKERLIGNCIWDLFPEAVGNLFYRELHRALAEQRNITFEHHYWERWFENRLYPSPDGVAVFTAEITERKQIEQEREHLLAREQAAREQAETASRLKDEFLALVSHELRTPLTAITGWVQLLMRGSLHVERREKALEIISQSTRAQTQLIDDLLDVSRIITGKMRLEMQEVSLPAIVQAALDTVRPAAEAKRIALVCHLDPAADRLTADEARLQQVIWNLLVNAVKFTPEGGQVQIVTRAAAGQIEIEVADSGIGIDPVFLPHIFDRFSQAEIRKLNRSARGLGLGLALVRHITEMHGGEVAATSEGAGRGATITVRLPQQRVATPATDSSHRDSTAPPPRQPVVMTETLSGLHLLVVDDEEPIREFLEVALTECGAVVATAATAREALDHLAAHTFDLLLVDIAMPEQDGYSLIRTVRAHPPARAGHIPAIALTAFASATDRAQALAAGFEAHLAKPVELPSLLATITHLIGAQQQA